MLTHCLSPCADKTVMNNNYLILNLMVQYFYNSYSIALPTTQSHGVVASCARSDIYKSKCLTTAASQEKAGRGSTPLDLHARGEANMRRPAPDDAKTSRTAAMYSIDNIL